MNLFKACEQFKAELKENFDIDVEITPTQVNGKELGFTMFRTTDDSEQMASFSFDPNEK